MITFETALKNIFKNTLPLRAEKISIEHAVGRVLLEDICSALDMPPFDKSAVDGYAVKAADLRKTPETLRCIGLVQAGDVFKGKAGGGECVKIMTGAPLPAGMDSVVMVEDTAEAGGLVKFSKAVKKGDNVCVLGEDIKKSCKILARGTVISVSHIAVLAAVGRSLVKTGAMPKVALINTGGEIVPPGAKLGKNRIYNSNGPMLCTLLKSDGIAAVPIIVKDDAKKLKAAFAKALKSDIVLISGGVSMGDYDLVPAVLKSLGVREIFHKVKVKPGKPLFFGRKGGTIVFGIPGNPVSNFLAYLAFIRPAILKMSRRGVYAPEFKTGVCAGRFTPNTPRKAFVLSKVREKEGKYTLTAVLNNGSADILALSRADGFTVVDEGKVLEKNEKARFISWKAA
ncbi:MAG: molybdopterin molybdotransferase MoeA [Elusimicrobia bacterium]|nr:molybdopterin molybdotransferase MoeA [Elusimicrobiota bacterium]